MDNFTPFFWVHVSYGIEGDKVEYPIRIEHIPEDRANTEQGYPCPNCGEDPQGGGSVTLFDGWWECDVCPFAKKDLRELNFQKGGV